MTILSRSYNVLLHPSQIEADVTRQQTLYNLNRWIGVRINGLTAIVGVAAGAIALTATNLPPGLIGFSLTNALAFSSSILYAVR